jgi:hypothetical protein
MVDNKDKTQDLVSQFFFDNKAELDNLLNRFKNEINKDEMLKFNELWQNHDSIKPKRPPNSFLLYSNQLRKCGLYDIIKNFCGKHGINRKKQNTLLCKITGILWKESVHQKFFKELALEVKRLHQAKYPNYKFQPKKRSGSGIKFKYIDPNKTIKKSVNYVPPPLNYYTSDMAYDNFSLYTDTMTTNNGDYLYF